jgi:hypothetical protein
LKHLFCKFFNHELVVKENVTQIVKEYNCIRCHKEFTTSDTGKTIPLTIRRKEINITLRHLYKKRLKFKKSYS